MDWLLIFHGSMFCCLRPLGAQNPLESSFCSDLYFRHLFDGSGKLNGRRGTVLFLHAHVIYFNSQFAQSSNKAIHSTTHTVLFNT